MGGMGCGDRGCDGPAILSKENLDRLDGSVRDVMRKADEIIGNGKALDVDRNRYFEMGRLVAKLDTEYKEAVKQLVDKYGAQIQNIHTLMRVKMK